MKKLPILTNVLALTGISVCGLIVVIFIDAFTDQQISEVVWGLVGVVLGNSANLAVRVLELYSESQKPTDPAE